MSADPHCMKTYRGRDGYENDPWGMSGTDCPCVQRIGSGQENRLGSSDRRRCNRDDDVHLPRGALDSPPCATTPAPASWSTEPGTPLTPTGSMAKPVVDYADQAQRDHRDFVKAVRQGRIKAVMEA